ncbi:MAG: hypothetical protein HN478_01680 [Rhodospirillaceae bacterium]|jgi:hypothetical protein|nr:hypothetical protein [Rhodospirillaceae bacterium]MBT5192602.1 hypothetical protein [Rhodospirillaceae bacterium]MBT5894301.1 hypothetical protein [Rhodospirillaceae bacterium]MBT6426310.1 hypothetical protein [Rhodospirillaceae bacterium]MBT7664057.1 hypothetical protein [Rhodospirillaceae bacterium]
MAEFWRNSGFQLLSHGEDGFLKLSGDFLRAYLHRPELAPVEESCQNELRLHAMLVEQPMVEVSDNELAALEDEDARQNFQLFLNYRARMSQAENLEQGYLNLFRPGGRIDFPPLFVDHLSHVILHNILKNADDSFELRAGELFFREQDVRNTSGTVMLVDVEAAQIRQQQRGSNPISLLDMLRTGSILGANELETLTDDNVGKYLDRSEAFDFALDLTYGRRGSIALCRVMERWVSHFLGVSVSIEPQEQIDDDRWSWHIGLDVEASALLNDLYEQNEIEDERLGRLLSLYRLTFDDDGDMRADLSGRPIYLGLCIGANGKLRFKPQNLLVNLPLAATA